MIPVWIQNAYDNQMPSRDSKEVVFSCAECGCEIYEGETIHFIGRKVYCDDCHREDIAEREIEE